MFAPGRTAPLVCHDLAWVFLKSNHRKKFGRKQVMQFQSLKREWQRDGLAPYRIGTLFMTGLVIFCWVARGPDHPVYGLVVVGWTLVLGPVLAPTMLRLPARWFCVPAGEHILHRMLGVGVFGWLLDCSGWNRHVALPMRGFNGTRAALGSLELSVRAAASAHAACFVVHIILAALALFSGYSWAALWILLPGVVVHLYPVLLQRSIMLRLQPLLDKSGCMERSHFSN
jgi:hypothetical protein